MLTKTFLFGEKQMNITKQVILNGSFGLLVGLLAHGSEICGQKRSINPKAGRGRAHCILEPLKIT